jgi:hypothetical protein
MDVCYFEVGVYKRVAVICYVTWLHQYKGPQLINLQGRSAF